MLAAMLRRKSLQLVGLSLAALVGCSSGTEEGPAPVPVPDGAAPFLAVGTGANNWVDLDPARATMAPLGVGSQGGYHIWVRLRFRYFAGTVSAQYRVEQLDGTVLSDSGPLPFTNNRGLTRWGEGFETNSAYTALLGMFVPTSEFVGNTYRLIVVLRGEGGVEQRAAHLVTMTDPQ